MQLGLKLNRNGTVGLRDQIVTQLARLILDGHLQPDMRLPSCRNFAKELEVSVNTVIAAYEILEEQQLILSRSRSGFFVLAEQGVRILQPESTKLKKSSPLRDRLNWQRQSDDLATIARPENWYDFKYPFVCNQIDEGEFPVSEWRECSRQAMNRADLKVWSSDGHYSENAEFIEQIRTRILPRRGVFVKADSALVTLGAQNGLYMASHLLGGRDRVAVIEDPGYPDARKMLRSSFGELKFQPVDDDGMIVDERLKGATMVFVTPNRQFPTTVTMSEHRRQALIEAAEEHDFFIVEDDYECDVDYRHFTPLPLFSMDNSGRVIYLASLSKGLSPGLRLGYMTAAEEFITAARDLRGRIMRHPPTVLQLTAAAFIRFGQYESRLRRIQKGHRERWEIANGFLRAHFPNFDIKGEFGGTTFVLSDQEKRLRASEIAGKARERGVIIEEIAPCYSARETGEYAFRVGVSAIHPLLIEAGLQELKQTIMELGA